MKPGWIYQKAAKNLVEDDIITIARYRVRITSNVRLETGQRRITAQLRDTEFLVLIVEKDLMLEYFRILPERKQHVI